MSTARSQQRQKTRAEVLKIAQQLFQERGFAHTTICDIAAAAGVSVGTVMSVGDKNALLVASFDQTVADTHKTYSPPPVGEGTITERILARFLPFITLFAANLELARIYGANLVTGVYPSALFTELQSMLIAEITTELIEHYSDPAVARQVAESMYFAYVGRMFTWPLDSTDVEALTEEIRRIIAAIIHP